MANTPACPNPLKPADCVAINNILASINATMQLIAKCEACQIPMEEWKAINAQQQAVMESVKRQFFPNNA